ncbi:helix-turn-helix domain-containing protein [Nitrosomonas sp. JL21]|uniref:RodZ domain-containing protein n=1 Tax=Nitrosomonas sp. JL21 TaxID=153949 RepID=UPI00136A4B8D|nr:RodZ domain-containing protein [Nitrosomonas sp. JL21]MBL8496872.1 helix-turn-helix domain-containing protein [Nitrosomonas sp.]MBL8498053.1 helix-turn-helix domain-containing protein [Nitrosomonas sp.]MCC7092075.1 helix-turn-helix domain-containing protein [Nitrosomonas sp.]MXS77646.1 helix-turn-helix domain-containing protein [Nitrosomonas sp. JL21]
MNDNQQRIDGSDPLSSVQGASNVDFNSASVLNRSSQTESDNIDHSSPSVGDSTLLTPEQQNMQALDPQQTEDSASFSADQAHSQERTEVNSQENSNLQNDYLLRRHGSNSMDSASIVHSVGHILRKARMARGLSIDDVSRQLRLSNQQVEAIEKEDFGKLPGRTFLRGFVRNYANLCQLNPEPLLQMLPESEPARFHYEKTPLKNKNLSFSERRENSSNKRVMVLILLFAAVLGAYFVIENNDGQKLARPDHQAEVKIGADKASVEIPLPLSSGSTETPASSSFETALQLPGQNSPANASNLTVQTLTLPIESKPVIQEAEKPLPTLTDIGTLHFKFNADSWVKVVDGKNATILEQLRKGGSEQTITGKRPLSVVLGNATGVRLTYNDKDIDLSSYKKQDGTARLTLE